MIAQLFYENGVTGVVIEDPEVVRQAQREENAWDYADDSILAGMEEAVLVKAYLNNDATFFDKLQLIKDRIKRLLTQDFGLDMGLLEITLSNVREDDWANSWKKYYKPVKVSDRIVIKPTWETYQKKPGEVLVEMDPGMAFGTGTHETTVLCLRMLDRYCKPGDTVVDIGCGTGVLAIASVLLGAERAIAVDLDGNAVRAALQNRKLNRVEDRVDVISGNLLDNVRGRFTIAVANIIADVIVDLIGSIQDFMTPGGLFIASGIIRERLGDVTDAVEGSGMEILARETMGEWAAVVCGRGK